MARKSVRKVEKVFGKEIVADEKYYLNNQGLPTAESTYEWTPEMVGSMQKAMKDICYFAQTFFTIIDKTKRKTISLRKYQKRILNTMMNNNRVILLTSRQVRKVFIIN